jgi:hypothetical protein
MSAIESKPIEWLYRGYLPRGMVATLFAPKGRGKTMVSNYLTARLTSGKDWDDGTKNVLGPQTVLRFNLEDPVQQVLKPELYAAGANLDLVEYVEPEAVVSKDNLSGATRIDLSDAAHVAALERKIEDSNAALVIIEPLNNYKGKAKSISEDEMRPIYMALAEVANVTGAAILVINHANKKKDVDVLEKSLGASSGPNVARVNFFLEKNPDNADERILTNAGSNIPVGPSLVFSINATDCELDGVTHRDIGYARFIRVDTITGDELLERSQSPKKSQANRIREFLTSFLDGKGEAATDNVRLAAANEDPEWSWDLIKVTFGRMKGSKTRTEGGGKSKRTFWSLDHGAQSLF